MEPSSVKSDFISVESGVSFKRNISLTTEILTKMKHYSINVKNLQ